MPYCTAEEVKDYTGYREEDFNFLNPGEFDAKIEAWITQADAMIDSHRGRTFDPVGEDAEDAALLKFNSVRITKNIMAEAVQSYTSPVERIDDFTTRMWEGRIITPDINATLRLLSRETRWTFNHEVEE